ncbi:hypothetical protein VAEU17_4320024 [Vibrio aestuarianus]|nr:hypothetical protein VAEU17_4320024 [Vibrio aestuarianus]
MGCSTKGGWLLAPLRLGAGGGILTELSSVLVFASLVGVSALVTGLFMSFFTGSCLEILAVFTMGFGLACGCGTTLFLGFAL